MLFTIGEQTKVQKGKKDNVFNTETMLAVSEIKNNTVILKDGWLRAILKVTGLNLDLKNYDEQQIILEQYKKFLNGMQFPIQILVRNTYLDLTKYLSYMNKNLAEIDNPALKWQGQAYVDFLQDIDAQQWLIFVKEFYIIIPYYQGEADTGEINKPRWKKFLNALDTKDSVEKIVSRYRSFVKGQKMLETRCNVLMDGLASIGIPAERLDVPEIINLLFRCYNPNLHSAQANQTE